MGAFASCVVLTISRAFACGRFNPPVVSRLVEIIRTAQSSERALATVVGLSRRVAKVPVVVGSCAGFAVNRLFTPYSAIALWLVQYCGLHPYALDRAVRAHGSLPIGPFALGDLVGHDVGQAVSAIMRTAYGERFAFALPANERTAFVQNMVAARRLGRLTGRGWYLYEGSDGKMRPDPEVEQLFGGRDVTVPYAEAVQMMLYLVAMEGARLMDEGLVARESDIDVATVLGYGFPAFRGGVMHWARHIVGWRDVCDAVRAWRKRHGIALFEVSSWAERQASKQAARL